MPNLERVRPSPIAGRWYPADPAQLRRAVKHSLATARLAALPHAPIAVLAPHAGHSYSGDVAGVAFAALQGYTYDLVAIVGPLHYPYPYTLITSLHSAYATPLGEVPIDVPAQRALEAALQRHNQTLTGIAQDPEHALEIELPFLQCAISADFTLLPVMVRSEQAGVCKALGQSLADALSGRRALLVASSDLSHFKSALQARQLDQTILQHVTALDPEGLLQTQSAGRGYACGAGALAAVLWAAKALGAKHGATLRYATSGDITGDQREVVGYAAAVLW